MDRLQELMTRYPALQVCQESICRTVLQMKQSFATGGRLYICGNGGSAADALHMVGEMGKAFVLPRRLDTTFENRVSPELAAHLQGALPAFALVENSALSTAYTNDVDGTYSFAQQVYAYAREGDCVFGISTSGNSNNILYALETARGRGAVPLGLAGRDGGKMKALCDECIIVPENETFKIQELHLPIYHALCLMLEEEFWGAP